MIQELRGEQVFQHTSGRAHVSFPTIKCSPLAYLNVAEFFKWLQ